MPWEKSFDLDDATDKATEVFWKKGYEATSMAELIDAMQINKGSLYNAFGSKQALFDRALTRFDQKNRVEKLAKLRQQQDALSAIQTLFDGLVDETRNDPHNLGCFIINTAQDLPNQPPEVSEIVRTSLSDIEDFFDEMIRKGQNAGQIPDTIDARKTAQALLSMLVGLRLLARGSTSIPAMESIKEGAMRLLKS